MSSRSRPDPLPLEQPFDPTPLEKCATCGRPLSPNGVSLWFCTLSWEEVFEQRVDSRSPCQDQWFEWRAPGRARPETRHALAV